MKKVGAWLRPKKIFICKKGWTLVETSDGTKGKVPTDHVSWSQPGENKNVNI